MGELICVYCKKPARQNDGVPVCDPYCEPSSVSRRRERWPWLPTFAVLFAYAAISAGLVVGSAVATIVGLMSLVLAGRALVYYALARKVPK